jgi:hypothetical protein
MKPCRHYFFYLDRQHHLIDSSIISSARDTYNAMEVAYVKGARQASSTTTEPRTPAPSTPPGPCPSRPTSLREDFCRRLSPRAAAALIFSIRDFLTIPTTFFYKNSGFPLFIQNR